MIDRRQRARRQSERRRSVAGERLIKMLWDTIWDLQMLQQKAQEALREPEQSASTQQALRRTIEHARAAEVQATQDLEAMVRSSAVSADERRQVERRVAPDRRQPVEVGSMVQP